MVSSTNVVAAPVYSSKHDLPKECEASKTTAKFVSSPSSWLQDQDQDKVHAEDDDGSTTVRKELTPTSTIMSEHPDSTDG
ncbi:hypothetical protein HO133_007781 [Letharia lupina]|uniref:Uncharacterized protein n=1 Tax=Letharia lupina TaxID=560253 RepID=A0A8H6CR49_9LECA|nr:uncharacterized protein HO133_007781 [Letharia lupina]KAF6228053.1 hypothetical protein HO133_007781 [Letharia lupina]